MRAEAEITPQCDGCNRCVAKPTVTRVQPAKPVTKSSWLWPVDNRTKTSTIPTDPRSQVGFFLTKNLYILNLLIFAGSELAEISRSIGGLEFAG